MKLKYILILILGVAAIQPVMAQQVEELVFTEKTYDFGKVKEADGPIIHEFSFMNKGMEPIKITNVKASCGCTTPDWSRDVVKPGETGFVQAQYNPHNRPGSFNKSLTVTLENKSEPIRLYIKGHVTPKSNSPETELTTDLGAIKVKHRSFNIGKVYTSEEPTVKEFEVYNDSDKPINFKDKIDAPDYIKIDFVPNTLKPKEQGVMKISYFGNKKNDYGFSSDNVRFFTDEAPENADKSIAIYATVLEYFPPMNQEEIQSAPKIKIMAPVYDFGTVKADKEVKTTFTLVNNGKNELKIRQVKSNCSCTMGKVKKETLKSGETTELEVVFNSEGRRGNQQKSITVYSNDPINSAQRVTIKAYVDREEDSK